MDNFKKLKSKERKAAIAKIVDHCRSLGEEHIRSWKPVNPEWQTVDGVVYLRLSTDEQVAVEKGSLEQQVNIAIAESIIRSNSDRINYRIVRFFIEPGITGQTDNRPAFDLMKKEIQTGKPRFVIFKEIARIARETTIWKEFFKLCIAKECEIFIRGFPLNPNDPAQVFQLDMLAAFAEYESKQTAKRIRESHFAAMTSSGKFNSTQPILGLDQLVSNEVPKVGFYTENKPELETVQWIMRSFIKYGSYQRLLEECASLGIKNKNGSDFTRGTLLNLLTNKKYIGVWELNTENREKNQTKLMPYDRYTEVDLPHGCVIDRDLWDAVQRKITSISAIKSKNTKIKRIYPLHGVLKTEDKLPFHGTGAWGANSRSNYYFNKATGLRISAEALEAEARKVLSDIIRKTPKLQEAIQRRCLDAKKASGLLDDSESKLRDEIQRAQSEQDKLNKRLDFLLKDSTEEEIAAFKEDYRKEFAKHRANLQKLNEQLKLTQRRKIEIETQDPDWNDMTNKAGEILKLLQDKDPVALKNAYRELFEAIIVKRSHATSGIIDLHFVLKDGMSSAEMTGITAEEKSSVSNEMVVPPRIELGTEL